MPVAEVAAERCEGPMSLCGAFKHRSQYCSSLSKLLNCYVQVSTATASKGLRDETGLSERVP